MAAWRARPPRPAIKNIARSWDPFAPRERLREDEIRALVERLRELGGVPGGDVRVVVQVVGRRFDAAEHLDEVERPQLQPHPRWQ